MKLEDTGLLQDGRALILAYDHGLEHGPSDLLGTPGKDPERIFQLAAQDEVTALAVQKGVAETYYPSYDNDVNLLMKLNGGSSLYNGEPDSALNCTIERAAELGADAVGMTLYPGSENEHRMFEQFRDVQEAARYHGMPVIMWSYPRGSYIEDDQDPEIIKYAARIALELGADMAKVKHPGTVEDIKDTVQMAGDTEVVLSGGAKSDAEGFLEQTHELVQHGFSGLAVGRNVWQRDDPETYLEALGSVIHESNLETALNILR